MVGSHWAQLGGWPDSHALLRAAEKRRFLKEQQLSPRGAGQGVGSSTSSDVVDEEEVVLPSTAPSVSCTSTVFPPSCTRTHCRLPSRSALAAAQKFLQKKTTWLRLNGTGHWESNEEVNSASASNMRADIDDHLSLRRMIDVGAHIGSVSILFAVQGYSVLAVEPLPRNAAYLRASVAANKLENLVHVVQAAVSNRSSTDGGVGSTSPVAHRGLHDISTESIFLDRSAHDSALGVLVPPGGAEERLLTTLGNKEDAGGDISFSDGKYYRQRELENSLQLISTGRAVVAAPGGAGGGTVAVDAGGAGQLILGCNKVKRFSWSGSMSHAGIMDGRRGGREEGVKGGSGRGGGEMGGRWGGGREERYSHESWRLSSMGRLHSVTPA